MIWSFTSFEAFSCLVEIDETYIGGLEKNKHAIKRTAGVQGRSPKIKTPIVGMIQRGGEIRAKVVERVTMREVENNIVRNAAQIYEKSYCLLSA